MDLEGNVKSIILYDSLGGNTQKVAERIHETVLTTGIQSDLVKISSEDYPDFYDVDLVFIGSPVIMWLPTQTMINFVKKKLREYSAAGKVLQSAPIRPGKFGVCFGTFAGPHIGLSEARPMTMWLRAFLEHLGYTVLDEWHIVGEFQNKQEANIGGRLGNIQGRPNEYDLMEVENKVKGLLISLNAWLV